MANVFMSEFFKNIYETLPQISKIKITNAQNMFVLRYTIDILCCYCERDQAMQNRGKLCYGAPLWNLGCTCLLIVYFIYKRFLSHFQNLKAGIQERHA